MIRFGICFSKEFVGNNPLERIIAKRRVYLRLLEFCQNEGWETYILTRKTYKKDGVFVGSWKYENDKLTPVKTPVRMNIVYDRTAYLKFPPQNEELIVIDNLEFKKLCWNKWEQYRELKPHMAKTFLLPKGDTDLEKILNNIKTNIVVLKPINGLKGNGIFIGSKSEALGFKRDNIDYIVQEFIDTKEGIPGVTSGRHDLRVVIVNNKPVWCHVRAPKEGTYEANVARGGSIDELDYAKVPEEIKKIVAKVSRSFYEKYDNPIYSIDFGIMDGKPYIFEINDTIGFPGWEMKARDRFLSELVLNFKQKLAKI